MTNYDSLQLYIMKLAGSNVMRLTFRLKEEVDPQVLYSAAQKAMKRYPYLGVRATVEDNSYVLKPNDLPVTVTHQAGALPALGTAETNYHMISIDYDGPDASFNYSHTLGTAADTSLWALSILQAYVEEKYGVTLSCGDVRSPYVDPLPSEGFLGSAPAVPVHEKPGDPAVDLRDIISFPEFNKLTTPEGERCPCFTAFEAEVGDIIARAKAMGTKPSLYMAWLYYRAIINGFPELKGRLDVGMTIDCRGLFGVKDKFSLMTQWLHLIASPGQEDVNQWPELMGTSMAKQMEPGRLLEEFSEDFAALDTLDTLKTLDEKAMFYAAHCRGVKEAPSTLFSYFRLPDMGELAGYIDRLIGQVKAERGLFAIAYNDKVMLECFRPSREDPCCDAYLQVLKDEGIKFKNLGVFPLNTAEEVLPEGTGNIEKD